MRKALEYAKFGVKRIIDKIKKGFALGCFLFLLFVVFS